MRHCGPCRAPAGTDDLATTVASADRRNRSLCILRSGDGSGPAELRRVRANRVGGGVAPAVRPHHRTYSSYPAVFVTVITPLGQGSCLIERRGRLQLLARRRSGSAIATGVVAQALRGLLEEQPLVKPAWLSLPVQSSPFRLLLAETNSALCSPVSGRPRCSELLRPLLTSRRSSRHIAVAVVGSPDGR